MSITGAVHLAGTIEEHADDPVAQALALDTLIGDHVAPFYEDQAAIDGARLAALRHTIFGAPAPSPGPPTATSGRVSYAQLRAAAQFDPVVFRAYWRFMGMLGLPTEVYHDPEVVARTHEVLRQHGTRPPLAQPTRELLLAALAA